MSFGNYPKKKQIWKQRCGYNDIHDTEFYGNKKTRKKLNA
jgi:hypothetical protein